MSINAICAACRERWLVFGLLLVPQRRRLKGAELPLAGRWEAQDDNLGRGHHPSSSCRLGVSSSDLRFDCAGKRA